MAAFLINSKVLIKELLSHLIEIRVSGTLSISVTVTGIYFEINDNKIILNSGCEWLKLF